MTDLERQLEELFQSDSRSRGVSVVNVPGPRRNRLAPFAFVGAVALGTLALVLAISLVRTTRETVPASSPSPTASAAVVATGSPAAASSVPSSAPSKGPSVLKPDTSHGLITFEGIRTEADATNLQQPPQFSRTGLLAVSPDGKRVAVVRSGGTGLQLITFTTARPNEVTVLLEITGETVGGLVWAGDNSDSLLLQVEQVSGPQPDAAVVYSSLRSIDGKTKVVKEIVRITTARLAVLAWHPARNLAAAAETRGGGAISYDLVRGGVIERTPLVVNQITQLRANRDGSRILGIFSPAVRWWPVDQPAAARDLTPVLGQGRVEFALFRPGSDEMGVNVVAAGTGPGAAPGHFEVWNIVTGTQRLVSPSLGFSNWRIDGSAAISGTQLIDPDSGAVTPLPGDPFKIVDVVKF